VAEDREAAPLARQLSSRSFFFSLHSLTRFLPSSLAR
jgi:hypothetical protein